MRVSIQYGVPCEAPSGEETVPQPLEGPDDEKDEERAARHAGSEEETTGGGQTDRLSQSLTRSPTHSLHHIPTGLCTSLRPTSRSTTHELELQAQAPHP